MQRTLKFIDSDLEERFGCEKNLSFKHLHHIILTIICGYLITHTIKYLILWKVDTQFTAIQFAYGLSPLYGSALTYVIIMYLLKNFKLHTKFRRHDLVIMILSITILVFLNNPTVTRDSPTPFWDAFEIMIFNTIIFNLLRRWFYKSVYLSIVSIYFLVVHQTTIYDKIEIVKILGFVIILSFLFYSKEKAERLKFIQKIEQERSIQQILRALPDGIIVIDEDFNYLEVNTSFEKLFPELDYTDRTCVESFLKAIENPRLRPLDSDFKNVAFASFFHSHGYNTPGTDYSFKEEVVDKSSFMESSLNSPLSCVHRNNATPSVRSSLAMSQHRRVRKPSKILFRTKNKPYHNPNIMSPNHRGSGSGSGPGPGPGPGPVIINIDNINSSTTNINEANHDIYNDISIRGTGSVATEYIGTSKRPRKLVDILDKGTDRTPRNTTLNEQPIMNDTIGTLHACMKVITDLVAKSKTLNMTGVGDRLHFDTKYETRPFETVIAPIKFMKKQAFLLIFKDKTYSKLIKKLENASRHRNKAMSTVSHELRTPIVSSLYMLDSIAEFKGVPSECVTELVKPAQSILTLMLNLINDILDKSQLQHNKLKLTFRDVDIRNLIIEATNLIIPQAKKKGLIVKTAIDNNIPVTFATDPNRLTQIIINLLSNAYKFTTKGEILISAIVTSHNSKEILRISVSDTGIGIAPGDIKKLFQEFEKLDLGVNEKLNPSGCGLGLTIANQLAKVLSYEGSHGILVTSTLNTGSVFTFNVENKRSHNIDTGVGKLKETSPNDYHNIIRPNLESFIKSRSNENEMLSATSENNYSEYAGVYDSPKYVAVEPPKSNILKILPPYNNHIYTNNESIHITEECTCARVLVVDDDVFSQEFIRKILDQVHMKANFCFNGNEAVHEVKQRYKSQTCNYSTPCQGYKLIFMDCNMPIKDGFTASNEIKSYCTSNEMPDIRIIGLSAYSETHINHRIEYSRMDKYIVKPISPADIRKELSIINLNTLTL
jgi:signal transduction histidine kinase/CheY-like chemotaxis protein/PAS domain-containing protein